jgi:hypothetical protein
MFFAALTGLFLLKGAVSPWCGSFVYHLFMNLERGESVYYRLLQLDMFGIWMSQSFGECQAFNDSIRTTTAAS